MSQQHQSRLNCAEPLENRQLLSALPFPSSVLPADARSNSTVSVIEIESAVAEEEDQDVEVAPASLPPDVVAALEAEFPGATIVEAEFGSDDGEPEFGVAFRFAGRIFDVTFTPSGEMTEVEEVIDSWALPPAILEWVRQRFPGAEIDEAVIMNEQGVISYEVVIAPDDGDEVEAVLRLQPEAPAVAPADDASAVTPEALPPRAEDDADSPLPSAAAAAADPSVGHDAAPTAPPRPTDAAPPDATPPASVADAAGDERDNPTIALLLEAIPSLLATPLDTLHEWLPQIEDVLDDVAATFDPATIERAVQDVLRQIDAIAQAATGSPDENDLSATASPAFRFLAVLSLVFAAHLLRIDARVRASALNWCFAVLPASHRRSSASRRWSRRLTAVRPWHPFWYR